MTEAEMDAEYDRGMAVLLNNENENARNIFLALANRGHLNGQVRLGWMHFRNHGTASDDVFSHMWFNLASKKGHEEAIRLKAEIEGMPPEKIAEAEEKAQEWLDANPNFLLTR